jgi:heme A synthase
MKKHSRQSIEIIDEFSRYDRLSSYELFVEYLSILLFRSISILLLVGLAFIAQGATMNLDLGLKVLLNFVLSMIGIGIFLLLFKINIFLALFAYFVPFVIADIIIMIYYRSFKKILDFYSLE